MSEKEEATGLAAPTNRSLGELANRVYDKHQDSVVTIVGAPLDLVAGVINTLKKAPEKFKALCERTKVMVPEEHFREPKAWTAGPILDSMKYLGPGEGLWEQYERLLRQACDKRCDEYQVAKFTALLGRLSPTDLLVFDHFADYELNRLPGYFYNPLATRTSRQGTFNRSYTTYPKESDELKVADQGIEMAIDTILSCGLMSWETSSQRADIKQKRHYGPTGDDFSLEFEEKKTEILTLTTLGKSFWEGCKETSS